ncbi:MAG UNVERIFIED_CONTAM: hypothetical protein LVR18_19875 [Planctomycetaceae bacterium]|jgi:hypothetical protein
MTTTTAETRIEEYLQRLEWEISDARSDLQKAADNLMRRAQEAKANCEALMKNEPCSLMWTEFAEGDLRTAKEARARLETLIEKQRMLKHLAGG